MADQSNEHIIAPPEETTTKALYVPEGNELKVRDKFHSRKQELFKSRQNVEGMDLDALIRRMDKQYFNREANIPASELDPKQKPIAINNAFSKVQTALAILIDRNPDFTLSENIGKFAANREIMRSLAKQSWKNTNSLGQFKLSVFNCAKRGWFAGRTFNRQIVHDVRYLEKIDNKGQKHYTNAVITKLDDIAYMNLDTRNVWVDEQARPEDMYSVRDWMWREIWHIDDLKRMFPVEEFPNMAFVQEGGDTQEVIEGSTSNTGESGLQSARDNKKGMTEVFFYENQMDDWFIIEINGIMVIWEPLPQNNKRISLVTGYWNIRSAETIYGIGLVEEMEANEEYIDRILNMTMRQLLIAINPAGFYSGTEDLENENIKLEAGILRRTLDPDKIKFVEVPYPTEFPFEAIKYMEQKEESITGINKVMEGDPTQTGNTNTAFELGLNKESSLKRLKLPLKSFQFALGWEFENRIALIQQTYSDYQVERLVDEKEIQDYLDEVGADPDFYYIENNGDPDKEVFYKKQYREAELNLDQDDKGTFIESDNKKFFKIKPQYLVWSGSVTIDIDSILVTSEEMEKMNTLRIANILVPMFQMPPEIALKPAKQIILSFNKDPNKWFPDAWMKLLEQGNREEVQEQTDPNAVPDPNNPTDQSQPEKQTVVPNKDLEGPQNLGDNIGSTFRNLIGRGKK